MLAPNGTEINPLEDEQDLAQGVDESNNDGKTATSTSLEASAIGLSAVVDGAVQAIKVTVKWGEYAPVKVEGPTEQEEVEEVDDETDTEAIARKQQSRTEWHRTDLEVEEVLPLELPEEQAEGLFEHLGVEISWLSRPLGSNRIVSVFLSNKRIAPKDKRPDDQDYLYQPSLTLSGENSPFLPRQINGDDIDPDPDIASADLIYHNRLEFAVGHGVAADWDLATDVTRADKVFTEILPSFEVPKVIPQESDLLSMDVLASEPKDQVIDRLSVFLTQYSDWLDERDAEVTSISDTMQAVAMDHLDLARTSLLRMRDGLSSLEDATVFQAFQFANKSMALQRRRSVQASARRRSETVLDDSEISANWRPFQIGFFLQALAGIADPTHEDRKTADLLWFPTGGGKTEAYLGLTAFVLGLRRLRDDDRFLPDAGTSVIMRYTLRLLTIQQFQRALTLITACEHIRMNDTSTWGAERFTIGLWVGQSVTPNSFDDAKTSLAKLRASQDVYEKSPYQVLFCPWCGEEIAPKNYVSDDEAERTYINCWNINCDFNRSNGTLGIPALVVDAEIYRHPPSLLLATVDKFAQMTWNGRIQSLFGRVERYCDRHGWISSADPHPATHDATATMEQVVVTKALKPLAPPDLIIQDELHLISGPLGTLVGIYESAVDALCSSHQDGVRIRPKVIASTATVRRAKQQVRSLFDREITVFPPQGLDASDSFFATESTDEPGRTYVGVFGPGKSIKTTLVRTYGALLGRAKHEHDTSKTSETDAYMTLVGYFNSLRELGGAVRLVEDDVPSRLRTLERRGFCNNRILYENQELTSRKSSSRIADVLDKLDRTFVDVKDREYPIDILLSSNMLSVGVDIDRLGLMVVSGQPKTTAEYIQATSRVGRHHPGLVVQVYNWVRPRDISHYEQFRHYHDTFYRHVEATSVTPFSERARDRALPAVLVAHSRLSESDWAPETGAALFDPDNESVRSYVKFLIERSRSVVRHGDGVADELTQQLERLLFDWARLTKDSNGLVYSHRGQDKKQKDETKKKATLLRPMEVEMASGEWRSAGSLREVEEETPIVLIDYVGGTG